MVCACYTGGGEPRPPQPWGAGVTAAPVAEARTRRSATGSAGLPRIMSRAHARGAFVRSGIRRVLLVQIRAAREGTTEMTGGGLHYSLAGPVIAMSSVRSSSQIARNDREVELLRELWAREGVRLESVVFEHLGQGPLSWHLSPEEENALLKGWSTYHQAGLEHGLRALRHDREPMDSSATAAGPGDDTGGERRRPADPGPTSPPSPAGRSGAIEPGPGSRLPLGAVRVVRKRRRGSRRRGSWSCRAPPPTGRRSRSRVVSRCSRG